MNKDILTTKDRELLAGILNEYNNVELSRNYYDAIWDGYQKIKENLDEYDAFFMELFEDTLLSNRHKILRSLRLEDAFNLEIRELWRKYLIRFPELKNDSEEAYLIYEDKLGHIGLCPSLEVKFEYVNSEGEIKKDRLCICNDVWIDDVEDIHEFCFIDRMFLVVFLVKTWNKLDVCTNSRLRDYFLLDEILKGPMFFTKEEIHNILSKLGEELEECEKNKEN